MAVIHRTTLTPSKLDLLADWLPVQPWYRPSGRAPELERVGGFRLDDPAGEVGIEFLVVRGGALTYQVPMTYRDAPLGGDGLIGTTEHGVLGRRWVYDGVHDPVLAAQLVALVQGEAEPQAQSQSHTPDPTVLARPLARPLARSPGPVADWTVRDGQELHAGGLVLRIHRVLHAGDGVGPGGVPAQPGVSATWLQPGGARARGVFVTASEGEHAA